MLTVLRMVYAHRLLQDPGYTVEDVAAKLGYSQSRSFAQNVKDVFGRTPSDIRVGLSPDDALQLVREKYFRAAVRSLARVG
jgi:AraC-like DNA-binding protein